MIKNIFATKTQKAKCIVFYCFDYDRQVACELFDFFLKYYSERYQLQFKFLCHRKLAAFKKDAQY